MFVSNEHINMLQLVGDFSPPNHLNQVHVEPALWRGNMHGVVRIAHYITEGGREHKCRASRLADAHRLN